MNTAEQLEETPEEEKPKLSLKEQRKLNPVTLEPLYNCVIARIDPILTKVGSVIVPDSAQETPNTGTIIAVGDGLPLTDGSGMIPLSLKVDERVLWGSHSGIPLPVGFVGAPSDRCVVLLETEVLTRIKGEPKRLDWTLDSKDEPEEDEDDEV